MPISKPGDYQSDWNSAEFNTRIIANLIAEFHRAKYSNSVIGMLQILESLYTMVYPFLNDEEAEDCDNTIQAYRYLIFNRKFSKNFVSRRVENQRLNDFNTALSNMPEFMRKILKLMFKYKLYFPYSKVDNSTPMEKAVKDYGISKERLAQIKKMSDEVDDL